MTLIFARPPKDLFFANFFARLSFSSSNYGKYFLKIEYQTRERKHEGREKEGGG